MRLPSERLAAALVAGHVVPQDDLSVYRYGLHQLEVTAINVLTAVFVGLLSGMLWQSALFLLLYIPLRKFAGGFHAKTELRCYLLSTLLLCMALYTTQVIPSQPLYLVAILLLASVVISCLAPVDSTKKPLDADEHRVYRFRCRFVLLIHWGVFLVATMLGATKIPQVVVSADLMLGAMLLLGWKKSVWHKSARPTT